MRLVPRFAVGLAVGVLAVLAQACACSQTCGPSSCTGCCEANGLCQAGTQSTSCGHGGLSCVECPLDTTCSASSGSCELTSASGGGTGGGGGSGGGVGGGSGGGTGGGGGGGSGGGDGGTAAWTYYDLDTHATNAQYLAMATDATHARIGVAYIVDTGAAADAGTAHDWEVHYLEWQSGNVTSQATLTTVQRPVGIALAFQPNGEPAVAYLGGDGQTGTGMSSDWFQSDPELQYRSNGATWTKVDPPFTKSVDITAGDTQPGDVTHCMSGVDTAGFVLGLWPSIAIDSQNTLYWAFRDVHSGQYPQQDWGGSDLKLLTGSGFGGWQGTCVKAGGDDKLGWGGHTQMVLGPNELPAMVLDREPTGPDNDGQQVFFTQLQPNGTWSNLLELSTSLAAPTGPALAYDSVEGFGVAWVESPVTQLLYMSSHDGNTWSASNALYGAGTGGWYPSLAMDPVHHEPAVAFYVCSSLSGRTEGNCTSDDELDVIQRVGGNWQVTLVDDFGSVAPITGYHRVVNKVGFLGAKRVVVYRPPQGDALRLAVEN